MNANYDDEEKKKSPQQDLSDGASTARNIRNTSNKIKNLSRSNGNRPGSSASGTNGNSHQTPNHLANSQLASAANGSGAGTTAGAGGCATAGAGGTAAGAGTAAGSGGGVAAGAGSGAAIGSVVPVAGTAAGATAGATIGVIGGDAAGNAFKTEAARQAGQPIKEKAEEKSKVTAKNKLGKQETSIVDDDDSIGKIFIVIISILLAVIIIVVAVVETLLMSIAGPVLSMYTMSKNGIHRCAEFFEQLGKFEDATFDEICGQVVLDIQDALKTAYEETCYQEVYQIAVEQEYDLERTIQSYNDTEFPYILEGDECNVNYSELLNIMSFINKLDYSVDSFEYADFKLLLEEKEFLRCLYDLKVERAIAYEWHLPEGCIGVSAQGEEESLSIIIQYADGSREAFFGSNAQNYCTAIPYGEVTVSRYPLKKLYDYFELDPYDFNEVYKTMNNYQTLSFLDHVNRQYGTESQWGSSAKSNLYDYELYTGEITNDNLNIYAKDIVKYLEFSDATVLHDVPLLKQGDPAWQGTLLSSGATIAKEGCCITSMAMVCSYFSGTLVTPVDLVKNRVVTTGETVSGMYGSGGPNRKFIANQYGFNQEDLGTPNLERIPLMQSELDKGNLIMIHINPSRIFASKSTTHFMVITGYSTEEACFYVNDPANRFSEESSYGGKIPYSMIAVENGGFKSMWSYGY